MRTETSSTTWVVPLRSSRAGPLTVRVRLRPGRAPAARCPALTVDRPALPRSDGDEFDDVGCTVAQQPGGTSHGARSAPAREGAGGKVPGSDGGSAGPS